MILFKKSPHLTDYIKRLKTAGNKIGFVPTMGALHKGHLSLLKTSLCSNDQTVCSIFINPTQFNDANDFVKYPVTLENDIYLLEQSGTQILFLPEANEIYPNGTGQMKYYDLGHLENSLEGKYRPGHFQGVCQVMNRLLQIVQPQNLYMGRKDYQQCMVVRRLLEILHSDIILNTCATLREPDGLAMSSRNARLNIVGRKRAIAIFNTLNYFKNNIQPGNLNDLLNIGGVILEKNQLKADYVEIADAISLQHVSNWDGKLKLIALIAAYVDDVRLIDNMILTD